MLLGGCGASGLTYVSQKTKLEQRCTETYTGRTMQEYMTINAPEPLSQSWHAVHASLMPAYVIVPAPHEPA